MAVIALRGMYKNEPKVAPSFLTQKLPRGVSEPAESYSIDKAKLAAGQTALPVVASDLREVYAKYPKSDVGSNMIENWSKIKPEDKTKIREAMDKDIAESKERLRQNPEDKRAKRLLKISGMMKMLAAKDFNIKAGEELAPFQTEDSSKR